MLTPCQWGKMVIGNGYWKWKPEYYGEGGILNYLCNVYWLMPPPPAPHRLPPKKKKKKKKKKKEKRKLYVRILPELLMLLYRCNDVQWI